MHVGRKRKSVKSVHETLPLTVPPRCKVGRGGNHIVPDGAANVVNMPADDSCLFHALSFGLRARVGAPSDGAPDARNGDWLRQTLIDWIEENPETKVGDLPTREWVAYDNDVAGSSVESYCVRMRASTEWGGAIEMAVYAQLFGLTVHVYSDVPGGFRCIYRFDAPAAAPTSMAGRRVTRHARWPKYARPGYKL